MTTTFFIHSPYFSTIFICFATLNIFGLPIKMVTNPIIRKVAINQMMNSDTFYAVASLCRSKLSIYILYCQNLTMLNFFIISQQIGKILEWVCKSLRVKLKLVQVLGLVWGNYPTTLYCLLMVLSYEYLESKPDFSKHTIFPHFISFLIFMLTVGHKIKKKAEQIDYDSIMKDLKLQAFTSEPKPQTVTEPVKFSRQNQSSFIPETWQSIVFDDYSKESCYGSVYRPASEEFKLYGFQLDNSKKAEERKRDRTPKVVQKFYKPFEEREKENIKSESNHNKNSSLRYLAHTETSHKKMKQTSHQGQKTPIGRNLFNVQPALRESAPKINSITRKVYSYEKNSQAI